ncbi:hypothetical protein [Methylobacterium sp. Leaf108]|nr:hypothetical protein [Methylobacterium sp. Leaf108]
MACPVSLRAERPQRLTSDQIRAISDAWKLPVALLIKPYHLEHDAA